MNQIPINHMAPLTHLFADLFLIGFTAACSIVAGFFFLRFWSDTRDLIFLGFAAFFFIQGGIYASLPDYSHPNVPSAWVFVLRLVSALIVLAAILWKNAARE